jgi:hypothetical protein
MPNCNTCPAKEFASMRQLVHGLDAAHEAEEVLKKVFKY